MLIALDGDVATVVMAHVVYVLLRLHDMNAALARAVSYVKSWISISASGVFAVGKPVEAVVVVPFELLLNGRRVAGNTAGIKNLVICVICITNQDNVADGWISLKLRQCDSTPYSAHISETILAGDQIDVTGSFLDEEA